MPRNTPPRRPGKPPRRSPPRGGKPPHGGKPPARAPRPPQLHQPPAGGDDDSDGDEITGATLLQTGERLQKVLAAAGLASRRECELLITEGRVEVDGQTVTELGARVDRDRQEIRVDGEPLPRPKHVYYAVHKPTGVVTTARDPAGRPRVIDLLPPSVGRVFTVGRLDLASEGLILLTNDGELANQLTHPKHGVEKTYEVQVAGQMENDVLAQLKRGVHLSEGYAHAVHARIKARLKRSTLLEMVLDEGRNREVRRLLARVGHKVQRLIRIAVGPIRLGDMPRGAHRRLTQEEVSKLRAAAVAGPKPKLHEELPPAPARPLAKKPFANKPFAKKPFAGKPPGGRPTSGRPTVARPVAGKPGARKPTLRKPTTSRPPTPDVAGAQDVQRKVIGDVPDGGASESGRSAAGAPPGRKPAPAARPSGGKPKFRPSTGTKAVGRKPVKRRRPERPQRGSKKP